jgi:hypothetical protein
LIQLLVPASERQNAISSLQSTKLGHIVQMQSPTAFFLSMITISRRFHCPRFYLMDTGAWWHRALPATLSLGPESNEGRLEAEDLKVFSRFGSDKL